MAEGNKTHDSRIGALEQGFESLRGEIHGIRTDLRTYAQETRHEAASRHRMQWSPFIAAIAVMIAIIGGLAAGPISDISRLEDWQLRTQGNRFTDRDGILIQGQVDKIWTRLEGIEDEDFKRPEADAMRTEILEQLRSLRDRMFDFHQAKATCVHGPPKVD